MGSTIEESYTKTGGAPVPDPKDLRRRAEEQAAPSPSPELVGLPPSAVEDSQRMLHELQVHQIELQMQNDELRRTQIALDAAQAHYFDLYDLAPVGYCSLSENGLILEANLTAAGLLDSSRSVLLRQPFSRFILAEDQDIFYLHLRKLRGASQGTQEDSPPPSKCELRMTRQDGAPFWAQLTLTTVSASDLDLDPSRSPSQEPDAGTHASTLASTLAGISASAPFFRVVITDITELKLAEQTLRESEGKYRALFTNEIFAICIFDIQSLKLLDVNGAFVHLYGYTYQELTSGMTILDITVEQQDSVNKTRQAESEGTVFIPMRLHHKKDGTSIPVEIVGGPYIWNGKRVMYGLIHDITPRLQAEQALRDSEATLNSFFNSTQAMMGIFRILPEVEDLEYLRLNAAAIRRLGITPETIPGLHASQSGLSASNRRLWLEHCRRCQESGQPVQFEYPREFPDGPHWLMTTFNSIEPGVFSFAATDITHLKRLQSELQQLNTALEGRVEQRTVELNQANRDLTRALRLRNEFLNNMSHELRTPLAGILGVSEALQAQVYGELSKRQEQAASTIYSSGRRLLTLVDNLLEMTQLAAGQVVLHPELVNVELLVQACMKRIHRQAESKRLVLHTQIDTQLDFILADEGCLKQILHCLLDNAVKFTPQSGTVGLEVNADSAARLVRWAVWDTGIGIPPEQIGQIFEPFVQLDGSLSRRYEGTGLGLAIVNELVKLHGGSIEVHSAPGAGSRFIVSLPWQPAE